ncbi:dephospho-CoA kinase [Vampirovibrio sp.]|uniref:dephospho-CoA kinase n=1 Tax=Vampirovibrio sp. TaxID=2717857 RepID=UPI0035942DB9
MTGKRNISFKIGITGNVCTGKTLVRTVLQRNGVSTLDAEEAAMNLLSDNPERLSIRLTDHFGGGVVDNRGRLSRKALSRVLYTDPAKKALFDEKLTPVIRDEMKRFLYSSVGSYIRAVESPTLLEDDTRHLFDEVWMVTAQNSIQIERLKSRNMLTQVEALHLVDSQWPQEKKASLSDRIIDNSRDIHQTEIQVREILDEIRQKLLKNNL